MEVALHGFGFALVIAGLFFAVTGGIGLIRMPDVYTRMHAAGMTDTMGAGLILVGLSFEAGLNLVSFRLLLIWAFILFTSPIATHALARTALLSGLEPIQDQDAEEGR